MPGKVSVRWAADPQLSAIHAAYVVAAGSVCSDQKTGQVLVGPATEINNRLLSASIDVARFWQSLFAESLLDAKNKNAVAIALTASGCNELQLEQIASSINNSVGECRLAFLSRFPKLSEQLQLRMRPLKDHWDSFGAGLLIDIAKQIWGNQPPGDWWPSRVQIAAVQPIRGGDGGFDSDADKIWIEAALTDIDPTVPELLRAAWLITQMAIETHLREKSSVGTRLPWALASVPIVLHAGANLQLISPQALPIEQAMRLWRIGDPVAAETVGRWWNEWKEARSPMPVALKALEQMLKPAHDPSLGIDLSEFTGE